MKRSLRTAPWLVIATLGLAAAGCEVKQALDDSASGKTEGREHIGGAVSPVMSEELFSSSNRASKPPKAAPSAAPAGGPSSAPSTPSSRPPVPTPSAPPTPTPVPPSTNAAADEELAGDDAGDEEATAATPPAKALRKLDIQLSTGVSLAQTGPDGTLMSFSIDYQFTATPPVAGARYGVVVQRRDGQAVLQEEKLKVSDTVQLLVPKWRPEDGPFYAFIVELNSQDRPIAKSESIELTGP